MAALPGPAQSLKVTGMISWIDLNYHNFNVRDAVSFKDLTAAFAIEMSSTVDFSKRLASSDAVPATVGHLPFPSQFNWYTVVLKATFSASVVSSFFWDSRPLVTDQVRTDVRKIGSAKRLRSESQFWVTRVLAFVAMLRTLRPLMRR